MKLQMPSWSITAVAGAAIAALSVAAASILLRKKKRTAPSTPYSSFIPSLTIEEVKQKLDYNNMRHHWYPVAYSNEVSGDKPVGIKLLGEPLCLYRDKEGRISCVVDRCPHRSAPLSIGKMVDGNVECIYHGWQFGTNGECTKIPSVSKSSSMPSMMQAVSKPVHEELGMIWVWQGPVELAHPDLIPRYLLKEQQEKGLVTMDGERQLDIEYGLMMDNLLDYAHIDFTHDGNIGARKLATNIKLTKQESEYTKFNPGVTAYRVTCPEAAPSSRRTRLNLVMHFIPPCFIRAEHIILGKKFTQVFMVIPSSQQETKLMFRFYFGFLPSWFSALPFVHSMWKRNNNIVIDQDMELLNGIARNEKLGAPIVGNIVNADMLIKDFREWRALSEKLSPWFTCWSGNQCRKEHIKKAGAGSSKSTQDETDIEDLITK